MSQGGGWDEQSTRAWSRGGDGWGGYDPGTPGQPGGPGYGQGWDSQGWSGFDDGYDDPGYAEPTGGTSRGLILGLSVVGVLVVALLGVVAFIVFGGQNGSPLSFGGGGGPKVTHTSYVDATTPASADNGGSGKPTPASSSAKPTRPAQPSGIVEQCSDNGQTTLGRAARGTTITSCPFADAVREAYVSAGHKGGNATVTAYSPVTGVSYSMSCSGDGSASPVVSCSGGNNALVYIY